MPTSPPTISALPTAPDPSDRPTFGVRAYNWSVALGPFSVQMNAVAANVFANATEAAAAAATATASAQTAVLSPGTSASSVTSLLISTGSKTLTIQTGKAYGVGQFVVLASTSAPTNYMIGQIAAHNSSTGSLTINVTSIGGGGTYAAWTLNLAAAGVSALYPGPLSGWWNHIINGEFRVWQRGTTGFLPGAYAADRWALGSGYLPGNRAAVTCARYDEASSDGSFSASFLSLTMTGVVGQTMQDVVQKIENVRTLAGKTVTLSFVCSASAAGCEYDVAVNQEFGSGGSASVAVLDSLSESVTGVGRKTLTFSIPSTAGKTVGANSCLTVSIRFWAPNLSGGACSFFLTDVSLKEGVASPSHEARPIGMELALCRRYTRVASIHVGGSAARTCMPIDMRATPTITGGGAGFDSTGSTADTLICHQTTPGARSLVLNAEL